MQILSQISIYSRNVPTKMLFLIYLIIVFSSPCSLWSSSNFYGEEIFENGLELKPPGIKGKPLKEEEIPSPVIKKEDNGYISNLFPCSCFTHSLDGKNLYVDKDTKFFLEDYSFNFCDEEIVNRMLLPQQKICPNNKTNHFLCSLRVFYENFKESGLKFKSFSLRKEENKFFFQDSKEDSPPLATFVSSYAPNLPKVEGQDNYELVEFSKNEEGKHPDQQLIFIFKKFTPIEYFLSAFEKKVERVALVICDLYSSLDFCDKKGKNCQKYIREYFLSLNQKFKKDYLILPFGHVRTTYFQNDYITQSYKDHFFYERDHKNKVSPSYNPYLRPFAGKVVLDENHMYGGEIFTSVYKPDKDQSFEHILWPLSEKNFTLAPYFIRNLVLKISYSSHLFLGDQPLTFAGRFTFQGLHSLQSLSIDKENFLNLNNELQGLNISFATDKLSILLNKEDIENFRILYKALKDENRKIEKDKLTFEEGEKNIEINKQEVRDSYLKRIIFLLKHQCPLKSLSIDNKHKGKSKEGSVSEGIADYHFKTDQEGDKTLTDALKTNKFIQKIHLSLISPKSAHILAKCLKNHPSLTELDLSGNSLDESKKEKIRELTRCSVFTPPPKSKRSHSKSRATL